MKAFWPSVLLLFLFPFSLDKAFAQSEKDVLRYSRGGLHGSARYIGLGGAFGAVGGDISAINSNPAGIALLRKNELSFTPSFNSTRSISEFMDEANSRKRFELAVEQAGLAWLQLSDRSGWESFHFGVNYDRIRGFNERMKFSAENAEGSLLNRFVRISNGIPLSELNDEVPFTGEMAYQTFVMDPIGGDSSSYEHRMEGVSHSMEREVEREGSMGKTRLSFGADYQNRYYFGASLGIPVVRFERKTKHLESANEESDLRDFRYEEDLKAEGYGIDLELGAIIRINDRWRIGASAKTPGLLRMEENWSTVMEADHGSNRNESEGPIQGSQTYRIRLPSRFMVGGAHFFGKKGLIALEYRYQNQKRGRLLSTHSEPQRESFEATNQLIRNRFLGQHGVRLGGEWRFTPFYLRAGYNLTTASQSKLAQKKEGITQRFSAGMGYRGEGFYLSFAYRSNIRPELTQPIDSGPGRAARTVHNLTGVAITGGTRF